MNHNLTFEDLENALMLISFDTVDEDGVVERETLAYTYADGKLKFYTFDAYDVTIDASFDPEDHEILKVTTYDFDPDDYEEATDLVKDILKHEGREIINEAPANEWEIVDNKVKIVVYNAVREKVAEHSWKSRKKKTATQKYETDGYPIEMSEKEKLEAFMRSFDAKIAADEREFRRDRRRLGFYLLLCISLCALFSWLSWRDGFTTSGIWLMGISSGLYLTQIVWCNFGGMPLGVSRVGSANRVKGRPWINGGFIVAVAVAILNGYFMESNGMNLASCLFLGEIAGIAVTFIWWVVSSAYAEPSMMELMGLNSMTRYNRKLERREARDFYVEILKRMFWLD